MNVKYEKGLRSWDVLKSCKHKYVVEDGNCQEKEVKDENDSNINEDMSKNIIEKSKEKDFSPNKLNNIESENNSDPIVTEHLKKDRFNKNKDGSFEHP